MCIPGKSIEKGFQEWGWRTNTEHGHYCAYSSGNLYSGCDPEANGFASNFKYQAGDLIEMQYKPAEGSLLFRMGN